MAGGRSRERGTSLSLAGCDGRTDGALHGGATDGVFATLLELRAAVSEHALCHPAPRARDPARVVVARGVLLGPLGPPRRVAPALGAPPRPAVVAVAVVVVTSPRGGAARPRAVAFVVRVVPLGGSLGLAPLPKLTLDRVGGDERQEHGETQREARGEARRGDAGHGRRAFRGDGRVRASTRA